MQVELFEGIENFNLKAIRPSEFEEIEMQLTLEDLKARVILCAKLGLHSQTDILLPLYKAYFLKYAIPIPYAFISPEQEDTLSIIFPTRYRNEIPTRNLEGFRKLADYKYDLIPLGVLDTWNQCIDHHLFSDYEIWTAEKRQKPDPILIGRRTEHPFIYPIARWGAELHRWEQLVKESRTYQGSVFDRRR